MLGRALLKRPGKLWGAYEEIYFGFFVSYLSIICFFSIGYAQEDVKKAAVEDKNVIRRLAIHNRFTIQLYVTDPKGRRSGVVPGVKKRYLEDIPLSVVFLEPLEEFADTEIMESLTPRQIAEQSSQTVKLESLLEGDYKMTVFGIYSGSFDVLFGIEFDGQKKSKQIFSGKIDEGEVKSFKLIFREKDPVIAFVEE